MRICRSVQLPPSGSTQWCWLPWGYRRWVFRRDPNKNSTILEVSDPSGRIVVHSENGRDGWLGPNDCDHHNCREIKSLALYRERPGAVNFEGERECSGRGVRDTAICSKPSASLSMGIEWSRPSRERRAKGTWVDFVTHRLRNIGGSTVSGRLCWRGVGLREGWASTRKPGAVERPK